LPISTELNDRQCEAVTTTEGPVLVIAGAGSGKTRVLTERIRHLVTDKDVEPWNILAFTFTNKAAREMKERLEGFCPGISRPLWVGTFHGTGVRILRRHGDRVGIKKNFSIYDSDDSLKLVTSIMQRSILDGRLVKSPRMLRDRISRMKDELITPEPVPTVRKRAPARQRAGFRRPHRQGGRAAGGRRRGEGDLLETVPLRPGRRIPGHQSDPDGDDRRAGVAPQEPVRGG
jgi:superfamily I DNA/RNA helicase